MCNCEHSLCCKALLSTVYWLDRKFLYKISPFSMSCECGSFQGRTLFTLASDGVHILNYSVNTHSVKPPIKNRFEC